VNQNLLPLGLVLSLLVACSRSPSPDQQAKALKTIGSWTATARLLGEDWQQERVPQHYTEQTLEKVQTEMQQELKDVPTPPAVVKQIQQTIAQMAGKVDRSQSRAFAIALRRLTTQQRQLDDAIKAQDANK
jgi:hypothetical protein